MSTTDRVRLTRVLAERDAAAAVGKGYNHARADIATEASRLIRTEVAGESGAHARYDPAARLMHQWYLDVAVAELDRGCGRPSEAPGAGAVEDIARQLRRLRPDIEPLATFRAVAVVWRLGQEDGARAVRDLRRTIVDEAPYRAAGHVRTLGGDALSVAILRHWYQRCHLAAADAELGLLAPLRAVTTAEASQVTDAMITGRCRRLIGRDGSSLITAHGTRLLSQDRRLAAGEVGVIDPPGVALTSWKLRDRVKGEWKSPDTPREAWALAAGLLPEVGSEPWADLSPAVRSKLIAAWLDTHPTNDLPRRRQSQPETYSPGRNLLIGDVENTAAAMFHQAPHPPAVRLAGAAPPPLRTDLAEASATPRRAGRRARCELSRER